MIVRAVARPTAEAVVYDGQNDAEVLSLVQRAMSFDPGMSKDPFPTTKDRDGLAGLWVLGADRRTCLARVEIGNVLVYDAFRDPALFVLPPDQFPIFYEPA